MELVSVRVEASPSARGRVRLVGDVAYDDRPGTSEPYWFDVPEEFAADLSLSGNPWLACLLPLAVVRREPLRLCRPCDPGLIANAARLMEIWSRWDRRRRPVSIEASRGTTEPGPSPREAAAFFSGGIDSFFMALRNAEDSAAGKVPKFDRVISVWGFDIPIEAGGEYARLKLRLTEAAERLGWPLLDVATNLRAVRFREADWGRLAHGGAMAGIGLALEPRFHSLCVAATHDDAGLYPWGSHPDTDPLFSTSITRMRNVGAGVPRSEKTLFVSRSEAAMRALHVCYKTSTADNCCNCRKCLLAMATLEVAGVLDRCPPLCRRRLDLDQVRRLYLRAPSYRHMYGDVARRARASGRSDLAEAISAAIRRSRLMKPWLVILQWLGTKRGVWRIARRLRLRTLEGSVQ
ncbi:MAG TPA: hypothetical protein VKG23_13610 [Thermoanaerobaculia bacterium]|nr:hypothetical protein [Thermoanaerobaculia bacterium]